MNTPFNSSTSGPGFGRSGPFDGKGPQAAAKWLKGFKMDMEDYLRSAIPPKKLLDNIDILLRGEAEKWATKTKTVRDLLDKDDPTDDDAKAFIVLFTERFPGDEEEEVEETFNSKLGGLKQSKDESLAAYYKRAATLLKDLGIKDRSEGLSSLFSASEFALDTIIEVFIFGIYDGAIRREVLLASASASRTKSFKGLYVVAEDARLAKVKFERL